jgi:uncharacterized membrane protein YgcG
MKFQILLLFVIFQLLNTHCVGFGFTSKKKTGREIADIPNPKFDPKACGREHVPHSQICDPDDQLSKDIKDEIEGYINAMKGVEIAVVIIQKMQLSKYSDIDKSADYFASSLHNNWGVGDKETQKGVVLFLSVYDRVVHFSTGKGVQDILSAPVIDSLISGMRNYLRKSDYGSAIIHTIIEMDLLLTRKIKSTYAKPTAQQMRAEQTESPWETFFAFVLFVIFVAGAFFIQYIRNRRLGNYEKGKDELNKLMKEVDNIKEHKFTCTSCPICLEDFPQAYIPKTTSSFPQQQENQEEEDGETKASNTAQDPLVVNVVQFPSSDTSAEVDHNNLPEEEEALLQRAKPVVPVNTHPTTDQDSSSIPSAMEAPPTATVGGVDEKQSPAKKPMALKCGHVFCRGCLEEYLNKPDGNKCPICRADIDPESRSAGGGHLPTEAGAGGNRSGSPVRNRRSFFNPFQRTTPSINTLWNYHPSSSSGSTTTGLNPGFGSYTQTTNQPMFHHYAPELRYRLYRIHHLYPDALTLEALRSMNSAIDRGDVNELRTTVMNRGMELTRMVKEIREASQQNARANGSSGSYSRSWGGGSSSGGRGGRW